MRAVNHALTGAVLAVSIDKPVLVLPLAVISHFVLDAIPHYDDAEKIGGLKSRNFSVLLAADAVLCVLVVLLLIVAFPEGWFLPVLAAFLAAAPDFMWAPGYWRVLHGQPERKLSSPLKRFHSKIQWYQKPNGLYLEVMWFTLMSFTLAYLLTTNI